MLLINTLMCMKRRREVIMETSSLSPMFEGPVKLKIQKSLIVQIKKKIPSKNYHR